MNKQQHQDMMALYDKANGKLGVMKSTVTMKADFMLSIYDKKSNSKFLSNKKYVAEFNKISKKFLDEPHYLTVNWPLGQYLSDQERRNIMIFGNSDVSKFITFFVIKAAGQDTFTFDVRAFEMLDINKGTARSGFSSEESGVTASLLDVNSERFKIMGMTLKQFNEKSMNAKLLIMESVSSMFSCAANSDLIAGCISEELKKAYVSDRLHGEYFLPVVSDTINILSEYNTARLFESNSDKTMQVRDEVLRRGAEWMKLHYSFIIKVDNNKLTMVKQFDSEQQEKEMSKVNKKATEKVVDKKEKEIVVIKPKTDNFDRFKTQYVDYENREGENFSIEELLKISIIAHELNIFDSTSILNYAASCHQHTRNSVDSILEKFQGGTVVKAKEIVDAVVERASNLNLRVLMKKDNFLSRTFVFIPNRKERLDRFKDDFASVSKDFDRMLKQLSQLKDKLVSNVDQLKQMYHENVNQYNDLSIHIAAGEHKIKLIETQIIAELQKRGDDEAAHDLSIVNACLNTLKSKLDSLRLIRISTRQTNPQIFYIINTNMVLANNITETENTLIPLWKKQFALGMQVVEQDIAGGVSNDIMAATSESIRITADLTHMSAEEATKLQVSGSKVDLKALQYAQDKLIETIRDHGIPKLDKNVTDGQVVYIDVGDTAKAIKHEAKVH